MFVNIMLGLVVALIVGIIVLVILMVAKPDIFSKTKNSNGKVISAEDTVAGNADGNGGGYEGFYPRY